MKKWWFAVMAYMKQRSDYEHGMCIGRPARRRRKTGEVQFVLWKAGQQGHTNDYWHRFDESWWPCFVAKAEGEKA
jgi:hypothetical protein